MVDIVDRDMVWEIRSGAATDAGGGFLEGGTGTDYSQQASAQVTYTDLVIDAATNTDVTSAASPFGATHVGNVINITGGTGFTTGRYLVSSVSGVIATLDRAVGTVGSTGGAGKLGGAVFMTDAFMEELYQGNTVWVKNDDTHSTGLINVARDGSATNKISIRGYGTTRGDAVGNPANRPTLSSGANAFQFDNSYALHDLIITNTSSITLRADTDSLIKGCKIHNTSTTNGRTGLLLLRNSTISGCEIICDEGHGVKISLTSSVSDCYIHDCSADSSTYAGLYINGTQGSISNVIIDTCGTGLFFNGDKYQSMFSDITIYNCITGINESTSQHLVFDRVIIDNCTTGHSRTSVTDERNPNYYNYINYSNNTADKSNIGTIINETALDPQFVDAANGDFETGSNMEITYSYPGALTSTTRKNGAVQNTGGGGGGGSDKIGKLVGFNGGLV